MNLQLEETEAAWAQCAAQVDAIIACHANARPSLRDEESLPPWAPRG